MTKSEKYFIEKGYKPRSSKICEGCGKSFLIFLRRDINRKRFCSRTCLGKINSKENHFIPPRPTGETHAKIGRTLSIKMKLGLIPKPPNNSEIFRGKPRMEFRGEKHPRWIKDRTKLKLSRFNCSERRGQIAAWRTDIFRRDNFTCQKCFKRGGKINAHHIKSWAQFPDERFKLENGVTLCVECHREAHIKI